MHSNKSGQVYHFTRHHYNILKMKPIKQSKFVCVTGLTATEINTFRNEKEDRPLLSSFVVAGIQLYLFIKYQIPQTEKDIKDSYKPFRSSKVTVSLLEKKAILSPDSKVTLYITNLPQSLCILPEFQRLIDNFVNINIISTSISSHLYSFECSKQDAIILQTFLPLVKFEDTKCDITITTFWQEVPALFFSNINFDVTAEQFKSVLQDILKSFSKEQLDIDQVLSYFKLRKNKEAKVSFAHAIFTSMSIAEYFKQSINFGKLKDQIIYCNWNVSREILTELERYQVNITLRNPLQHKELEYIAEKYGKVFKLSVNELKGYVVFVDKMDAQKFLLFNDAEIESKEYAYAMVTLYNFGNSVDETILNKYYISEFTKSHPSTIRIDFDKTDSSPKKPKFFKLFFQSIEDVDLFCNFVAKTKFEYDDMSLQPFAIPLTQKRLTIQAYNDVRQRFKHQSTIHVKNLPVEADADTILKLFSKYGTILYYQWVPLKETDVLITYENDSQMQTAINTLNDKFFDQKKIIVEKYQTYISKGNDSHSARSHRVKNQSSSDHQKSGKVSYGNKRGRGNSRGGNSRGGNSRGGNSRGGKPKGGNSRGGNSRGGNSRGGNSRGGNQQTNRGKGGNGHNFDNNTTNKNNPFHNNKGRFPYPKKHNYHKHSDEFDDTNSYNDYDSYRDHNNSYTDEISLDFNDNSSSIDNNKEFCFAQDYPNSDDDFSEYSLHYSDQDENFESSSNDAYDDF